MNEKANRMLCCAVDFKENPPSTIPMETEHTSIESGIENMMRIVRFEANRSLQQSIPIPDDTYLYPVDIDTENPGIVAKRGKQDIQRRTVPLPRVNYRRRPPVKLEVPIEYKEDVSIEDAIKNCEKNSRKELKKQEKAACRDIQRDIKTCEKIEAKERKKRDRENETPEEREERLKEQRAKRAEKKAEREAEKALLQQTQETLEKDPENCDPEENDDTNNHEETNDSSSTPEHVVTDIKQILEEDLVGDQDSTPSVLPPKLKMREKKVKFFASAVPFDRHLASLETCDPSTEFAPALLRSEECSNLQIIHGPPGTGKTTHLLELVKQSSAKHILICAPSNVAVANLNTRAINLGMECALMMPESRVPANTPIVSTNPNSRIVCATISMRNGSILESHEFDEIYIDEAGQCLEPWIWGLLRSNVTKLVMAGDIHQLPALVSEEGQTLGYDRSLMQRLMEKNYPHTFLNLQRRMHPEILKFPNQRFYEGKLRTEYTPPENDAIPYVIHHCDGTEDNMGTSYVNKTEATKVVSIALEMAKTYADTVILCPYQAQAREILSRKTNIPVHTIDSFQGREADAIVLSIVRTSDIGFWSDQRRLVVALTRARHHMSVVGNVQKWTGVLKELYKDGKTRKLIQ